MQSYFSIVFGIFQLRDHIIMKDITQSRMHMITSYIIWADNDFSSCLADGNNLLFYWI